MKVYQQPESDVEKEIEAELLALNGIPTYSSRRKSERKYRFYIYQFEVVALFQNDKGGRPWLSQQPRKQERWSRISSVKLSKEILKAKRLAIRTIYVLGYDVGMVEVSVHATASKYTVSKVFYHQQMAGELESNLQKAIADDLERQSAFEQQEPVLGADIELVLRHTGDKFVLASKYFSKKGRVGHDAIWLRGKRNSYPLVELRPAPSKSAKTLFKNTYNCLVQGVKKVNNPKIQWLAGGAPLKRYPIGGHLHFSKLALTPHFIRVLDNYLTLPLSLLESKESLSRRPKYGFLGDYREQYHGGFEYRTPPSWVVSPKIAKGVLCLAKVLSKEYKKLSWLPLLSNETHKDFYEGNRESLHPIVQVVWKELKATSTYSTHEEELDAFYELIEKGYVWNEYADIRHAWGLSPYSAKNMV